MKSIAAYKSLEYIELNHNCRDWINELLFDPSVNVKLTIKLLINDFTDSMMTRMRERDKFILSIVASDYIFLCHSKGKEATITPNWKVVERMLDKDNVERFVLFLKDMSSVGIYYYEHYPAESFTKWLGIPEKDAFYYLGGKNRFNAHIAGMNCAIELKDEDVERILKNENTSLVLERDQLHLATPISTLQIESIRVGKRKFNSMSDYIQNYLARRYDLNYYRDEYKKLLNSLDPITYQFIDDENVVSKVVSDIEQIHLKKQNRNFEILFATEKHGREIIKIRDSYFYYIYSKFLNKSILQIFHAGMGLYPRSSEPLKIGTMSLFNRLQRTASINELASFYNSTKLNDVLLDKAICYALFYLLYRENLNKPISFFFKKFVEEIGKDIHAPTKVSQNEGLIELKSNDYVQGTDEEISNRICGDLSSKLHNAGFKVYVFGIDEKTLEVNPIPSRRFSSDRLGSIERKIYDKSGLHEISLIKIPLDRGLILLMVARRSQ